MLAGKYDLVIEQGSAFDETVYWKDANADAVDITGYTGKAEVRQDFDSASPLLTFTLTLGDAAGTIQMTATAVVIRALDFDRAFWSLELSPGGAANLHTSTDNITLLEGKVVFKREATQ